MQETLPFGTLISASSPKPLSNAESKRRYNASPKGQARRVIERRDDYLSRPFIAWDGEGITVASGAHLYTSLQSSSGLSLEDPLGLSSAVIFHAMCDQALLDPSNAIHVIYGGGYDANMWLSDVPTSDVERLYRTGHCYYGEFRLAWRPSKHFRITRRSDGASILVNDVVSFFQRTFVAACDEYLGDRFIERDLIVSMKAKRNAFTVDDAAIVNRYNQAELDNLVLLMTELRLRLDKVGLRPSRWDGPGAIAVALMKREGVKECMATIPPKVAEAGRYAYAGGRFEVFKSGRLNDVYEYDINSAYPHALRHVPNLANGEWIHTSKGVGPKDAETFGLYRVEFRINPDMFKLPSPLWTRTPDGRIFYPPNMTNWVWAPEVKAAQAYVRKHGGDLRIIEGYRFKPRDARKPFAFIPDMYAERQVLKAKGDGAHVGIKLGLNSLYGKTCQRVGARLDRNGVWHIPPYHQLEWSGFVTSYCRAMLYMAVIDRLEDVIAFETDAMFVHRYPLTNVTDGKQLGEWEYTRFSAVSYGQSGFYAAMSPEGKPTVRTRGIDRGELNYDGLSSVIDSGSVLNASLTRFVGAGLAIQLNDWGRWRRWERVSKDVNMEPTGKRIHDPKHCCRCLGIGNDTFHETIVPLSYWTMHTSSAYPIPWINLDPNMTDLDEMSKGRLENMGHDYE